MTQHTEPSEAQRDIVRIRRMIALLLTSVEQHLHESDPEHSPPQHWWGEKETPVSILIKLTQLWLKIHPVEQQLSESQEGSALPHFTPQDHMILEEYVQRHQHYTKQTLPEGSAE